MWSEDNFPHFSEPVTLGQVQNFPPPLTAFGAQKVSDLGAVWIFCFSEV